LGREYRQLVGNLRVPPTTQIKIKTLRQCLKQPLLKHRSDFPLQELRRYPLQRLAPPLRQRPTQRSRLGIDITTLGRPRRHRIRVLKPPQVDPLGPDIDLITVAQRPNDLTGAGTAEHLTQSGDI